MLKTDAIKTFLTEHGQADLAALYHIGMECQVNVSQSNGKRVEGEYKGRRWHGWSDGKTTWKSFRIPYGANKSPSYTDKNMSFDLEKYVEGIGMTGWDWQAKKSRWVAFDFDSMLGHADGLTDEVLADILTKAKDLDFVTVRKSSSGNGYHLYVFLDLDITINNHHEHAALAKAVLAKMAALSAYDYDSRVDICGGNMWVWHSKCRGNSGFELVKKGSVLTEAPNNWRDYIRKSKSSDRRGQSDIARLTTHRNSVLLDDTHRKLIHYLDSEKKLWWWDQDKGMLVTHTLALQNAHSDLGYVGRFQTNSSGHNLNEQNCFCFPMENGSWSVRRYTKGVTEHKSWTLDSSGWVRTYLNRLPDLREAATIYDGLEDEQGFFNFVDAGAAQEAALVLGVDLDIPPQIVSRATSLKAHKDGRLLVRIRRENNDTVKGWHNKNDKAWVRFFQVKSSLVTEDVEVNTYDEIARSLVAGHEDLGWVMNVQGQWVDMSFQKVSSALSATGYDSKKIKSITGNSVINSWKLVNLPFQEEYPGDRQWNRTAAKLRYQPKTDYVDLNYSTWISILEHTGQGLDDAVLQNEWCRFNGIVKGADYLKCWVASLFQQPLQPLPYLFFYGPQDSGKSIFHESLNLLMTRGYQSAELALTNASGFNGELEGAVLCFVEETNLNRDKRAYNRIKDWVTSPSLNVRHMFRSPYHIPNSTHWVQCANEIDYLPLFPGDTRIVVCHVPELIDVIPKRELLHRLQSEAQDFITSVMSLEIPKPNSRLNIPVVESAAKVMLQRSNESALDQFIREHTMVAPGKYVTFAEFYDRFLSTCDPEEGAQWSKRRVGKEVTSTFIKGRDKSSNHVILGNIWWRSNPEYTKKPCKRFVFQDPHLVETY